MKVQLAQRAANDLDEILRFIALDNPPAADQLAIAVEAAIERAARFPKSGRWIPELEVHRYRELIVPPMRIFYYASAEILTVVSIKRSEQDFNPKWLG